MTCVGYHTSILVYDDLLDIPFPFSLARRSVERCLYTMCTAKTLHDGGVKGTKFGEQFAHFILQRWFLIQAEFLWIESPNPFLMRTEISDVDGDKYFYLRKWDCIFHLNGAYSLLQMERDVLFGNVVLEKAFNTIWVFHA